jgi:hypothetical protein
LDERELDDYLNQEKNSSEDLKENDNGKDVDKSRSEFSALDGRDLDMGVLTESSYRECTINSL